MKTRVDSGFGHRIAAIASVLFLAGCGGGNGAGDAVSYQTALFGNPTNQPTERPVGPQRDYNCPSVDILEGTAAYRVGGASSSDVSHQASIVDVARECAYSGSQFSVKIGVQGRMVIGGKGRPGTLSAPLRITIKRGETVVASRIARVAVSVPAGAGGASFAHVEEGFVLPISAEDPADEYEIVVGFDSGSAAGRRR